MLLTFADTRRISIAEIASRLGTIRSGWPRLSGSSHASHRSAGRISGIRSCTLPSCSTDCAVRIAVLDSGGAFGFRGSRHSAHTPAMQIRDPSAGAMKYGTLRGLPSGAGSTCHSYQPSIGTRHRLWRSDRAKLGLVATDSDRALISGALPPTSSANGGTSPQ